jgi:PAS domain S-box-containing protein
VRKGIVQRALNVLIIEDSEDDAILLVRQLRRGFQVFFERVETAAAMRTALAGRSWDVVISDYAMPHFSGLDALKTLQESGLDLPFILVSGVAGGEEAGVEAMRCGAHDYLMKRNLARLVPAVERELREAETRRERKQEEELLRLRTEALAAAANGIMITDPEGTIVWVNAALTALTGYTSVELLGRNPRILKSGLQDQTFYCNLWTTILNGRVWHSEVINRRKDGSLYIEEMTITPVRDSAGAITNFIAIKQDVTERKRAEEEIHRLNQDLERRVSVRTAELEDINRELEAFTYSVSHDLRAPLRHIAGFAKILRKETEPRLDPSVQGYLEQIEQSTRHMGRLIDELLNLARVSRHDLNRGPIALDSLVEEVVRELQPECSGREIEWQIGRLTVLECDPGLIKIVFTNLLSNALKFSRQRERAVIEVSQVAFEGPPSDVLHRQSSGASATLTQQRQPVVFVRDNGVGFDMKYADKLFGAFQRLHRQEDFEGVGVGLATVQRIIHRHGGRVWAEAELGKGATFYFTLSAPAEAVVTNALPEARDSASDVDVLLVEDSQADEALTWHELHRHKPDLRVHVAHDGEEALDFLYSRGAYSDRSGKNLPALVLLDLELPKLNGKEVLQVIRMEARTKSLPVVVLTGSKVEELPSSLRPDNGCYCIHKPLSVHCLQQAIHELGIHRLLMGASHASNARLTPSPIATAVLLPRARAGVRG